MDKFKGAKWHVVDDYEKYIPYSQDTPQIYIWDGDEQSSGPICDMGEMGDMDYAEALSNAHLIAAAPELLEALQEIVNACGVVNFSSHNQMLEAIEASMELAESAINKALGLTPKN